jgi:hypothetical protein
MCYLSNIDQRNARLAMQFLPVYSEPALGCPLFSASPDRGFSGFPRGRC